VPFHPEDREAPLGWLPRLLRRNGGMREMLDAPRLLPVMMRSLELLMQAAVRGHAWAFDVQIRPQVRDSGMLNWQDYQKLEECGRVAALESVPEIERAIAALRARVLDAVDREVEAPELERAPISAGA